MIGETVSHYRIIEKLGQGGMGVVYRAEDTRLKRPVALKFLPHHAGGTDQQKERFIHEAQVAAALDHPNICTVHEIDEQDGHTFIAMAFIEGHSLEDAIALGPLTLTDTTGIAIQVAEGLAAAHEKGIVHRDIKPGNVMITRRGRAKITDFGLARFVDQTRLTRLGMAAGTVAYMSPEQARGEEVDHRTDIWALGVMLHEMVTGMQPFEGDSDQAVIYSILSEEPEPMTALRSRVPMELERIAAKAMVKRAQERYQTMADMLVDLRAVARLVESAGNGMPRRARLVGQHASARRKRRRMMLAGAAVIVVAAAVVAGTQLRRLGPSLDPGLVVVAVFENRTGDELLDSVGPMAADCITQSLAQTGHVDVVPAARARESTGRAGNSGSPPRDMADPQALAEKTGAGTIVSGAYYLDGENLRFETSIADAAEGKLICALPPVVGPTGAPMATVDAVCQRVAGALATNYDPALDSSPPTFDAFRETIAGIDLWYVDWAGASDHFRRASELDSSYVVPVQLRAVCLFVLDQRAEADSIARSLSARRQELTPYERLMLDGIVAVVHGRSSGALRHLRRADVLLERIAPDRDLDRFLVKRLRANQAIVRNHPQEALDTLESLRLLREGWEPRFLESGVDSETFAYRYECVALHMLGDHEQELAVARRAHRLFPDRPPVRNWEIRALAALGRREEALRVVDECLGAPSEMRDPRMWRRPQQFFLEAAGELRALGYREASLAVANRGVELYRSRPAAEGSATGHRTDLAALLYAAERWDEARQLLEELAAEHPDDTWCKSYLGRLAARGGRREEALRISGEFEEITEPYSSGQYTYYRAEIAALLGDHERAVRLLQTSVGEGSWMFYDARVHRNMDLEPLRDYAPFQEFLRPKG